MILMKTGFILGKYRALFADEILKNRGFHVSNGPYVIMDMVYDLFAGRKDVERN